MGLRFFSATSIHGGSRRHLLTLYVAAIAGPTLVLVYLGFVAVHRQRDAIAQLSAANRRLQEQTLASTIEQRLVADAETCVRDVESSAWPIVQDTDWDDLPRARRARRIFEDVARRHRVTKSAFLIVDGAVRIPRAELPIPDILKDGASGIFDRELSRLFRRAEELELTKETVQAFRLYERIAAQAGDLNTRALASARMARCYEALGDTRSAIAAHRRLIELYPEEYSFSGRPYALQAAVELRRLDSADAWGTRQTLVDVRSALLDGRWELDPDTTEYFASQLGLTATDLRPPRAEYLQLTALARTLRDSFQPRAEASPGAVQGTSLSEGPRAHQVYYATLSGAGVHTVVGCVVNANYVAEALLPAVAKTLVLQPATVGIVAAGGGGTPLRSTLAWLEVVLREQPGTRAGSHPTDTFVFGGAVALVLGTLLLSVLLLLRDVARETATTQLRADLVGGVSHELKTPLTAIRIYGETLAADPDAPREERRGFYEVIIQESERLTRLIDRVLDFSIVESEARNYTPAPVAVVPLVEQIVAKYRVYVERHGFRFQFDAGGADEGAATIEGDSEAIARALGNLIDNALKYSGDDRWLCVRVRLHDAEVQVAVEDHGDGIAPRDRELIFNRFHRGANRVGRGGYGLGLYLVKRVMELHHGRVDVESEPGRGSRFTLCFPRRTAVDGNVCGQESVSAPHFSDRG